MLGGGAKGRIYFGDNLEVLRTLPNGSIDLIYIDPPFNTGKIQKRTQIKTIRSEYGDRTGFQRNRYKSIILDSKQFTDTFDDYLGFLEPGHTNYTKLYIFSILVP